MQGLSRQEAILRLKTRIEQIEKRPILACPVPLRTTEGAGDGFAELLATPPGLLSEVFSDERRHGGAALGFALALAKGHIGAERPALLFLQLVSDGQEMGLPYGAGLESFGIDPDRLVIGRLENIADLLWALEEAIACRAVAAVVADIAGSHKALDFTASRRLSLRAAGAGTSVFLIRYGRGREANAAKLRWRVMPEQSGSKAFDARAPGGPRWRVELEKGRLGSRQAEGITAGMVLDWTENGFERVGKAGGNGGDVLPAPSHGTHPAALGDRLSQAG